MTFFSSTTFETEGYVSDRVSRMFRKLCEHADLAADIHGQKHTMYSRLDTRLSVFRY